MPFDADISQTPAIGVLFDSGPEPGSGGVKIRYAREEEIFGEGEPAEYVYKVLSGAVRTYRILRDGRRQIDEFHFAGGYFGIEAGTEHRTTAEAMADCTVLVARRFSAEDLAGQRGDVARQLFQLTIAGLQRSQDHVVLLGRKSACERVASLLLDLSDRSGNADTLDIPMSRQDMADYLGLTIETVSRTLTQLQSDGVIEIPTTRRIVLSDRAMLEDMVE
ncbi:MAG TPA: helix-turn-helix domain-containing protein [Caulobacteraceae bacterium]|nr:helix-turn-helix domain-containing protein [Caulobacteraceae bacterium]